MSTKRKKTAAEYDAEVAARLAGVDDQRGRRQSAKVRTTNDDDEPQQRRAPATPKGSAKKKAPATPKSSAKKKSATKRAAVQTVATPAQDVSVAEPERTTSRPRRSSSSKAQLARLQAMIPTDAHAVDLNQLSRLSGVGPAASPSPSPSEPSEPDTEDEQGPRGYLTQKGLQTLKEYKYMSGFTGATDKYIMIPLWEWCLQFVPIWMAPNLLTTMSLACGVACYFLFQYHSPDFMDVPPAWVFYLTSFLMFAYLILDGLDGKQARRTGSSSPLGQLFDHGCDSICCFLCGIFMSSTLQLGCHRSAAIILFLHILPFYTSNWEEYTTGVMRFGAIGITEGQLMICGLLAATGYIGVDFWNATLDVPTWIVDYLPAVLKPSFSEPMERKFPLIMLSTVGVLYQVFSSSMSVWAYHTLHAEERKVKKIYDKAKRMFAHFMLFMVAGALWVFAPSVFYREHTRIVLLTVGMLFGYQVSRLIISRVTKDPYPFTFLNLLFTPYVALIVNCWIGEPLPTYQLAVSYLVLVTITYAHFVVVTINQITTFLGIRCFSIPYPKTKAQ